MYDFSRADDVTLAFLAFQASFINALISFWMDWQEKHAVKQWPTIFIFIMHNHYGCVKMNQATGNNPVQV